MEKRRRERILILAKTYPSPSSKFVETSCIAGINQDGMMRRIYPVPFRMIEEGQKFKKWQWIDVLVEKANLDHRPESHRLYVDTLQCQELLEPKKEWAARWEWLERIPLFESFDALEATRVKDEVTLGLVRPKEIHLEIKKARHQDWTPEEKEKLAQEQRQGDLFDAAEVGRQIADLKKVPFDFYYRYVCDTPEGEKEYLHKIVDWEAGALYWNCCRSHGPAWVEPFRAMYDGKIKTRDVLFLMGTIHRFPSQWLIISVISPPKRQVVNASQGQLF